MHDNSLHETLTWAASRNQSHKLILGDLNHPVISWDPSPTLPQNISPDSSHTRFVECIRDSDLHQHVAQPTRFRDGHIPAQDDLIFTNEAEMIDHLTSLDPLGASDHIGLKFAMTFGASQSLSTKTMYNYNKGDYIEMKNLLDINWENRLCGLSVQEMTTNINQAIMDAVERTVPTKKITPNALHKKPLWMNEITLRKVRKKHHAWIRYLNTKDGQDYQRYTAARNEATHTIKKTARNLRQGWLKNLALTTKYSGTM